VICRSSVSERKKGQLLSQDEKTFWEQLEIRLSMAQAEIRLAAKTGHLNTACHCLHSRIISATKAILVLSQHDAEGLKHDLATLLRVAHDAFIQLTFIVSDKSLQDERAADYVEFQHLEWKRTYDDIIKSTTPFAAKLRQSPKRVEGEASRLVEYERVKDRFDRPKGRRKDSWHGLGVRKIAEHAQLAGEYDFLHAVLHGSVHASARSMCHGVMFKTADIPFWAARILARSVSAIANAFGVAFTNPEIVEVMQGWSIAGFEENPRANKV